MSYFDSYEEYDYQPESRRNSNNFNEDYTGVRRKQPRYANKRRGGARSPRNKPNDNLDASGVFKEPRAPPRRSPVQDRRNDNYHRAGTSNKPYFDTRDMPRFVEPEHSSGHKWQWDNYFNNCKSWQEKHKLAYYKSRCLALEFENQMLFRQINSLIEENCIFSAERGEMPTMKLPDLLGKKEKLQEREKQPETTVQNKKRLSEELEKGEEAKKKKTTEDQKKEEEKKKEDGPTQPVGLKRKESLDQLYGQNAAMIHKLETSVQLNFNRNCDTLKPDLWPALPHNLNVVVE